ncbi:MAG TPA: methyltransferase domain-containing protein [Leeuwenhoekiella sp.]|nr:methyltransferase domain-containing protein [Leeuwenhoekiella sp.]
MVDTTIYTLDTLRDAPLLHLDSLHYDIGASLVLAPHPDDESLGCGGMLALLLKKDVPVYVAFITNGNASHPNSLQFPPAKLAALRKQEAITACSILGIAPEALTFFDQPDGKLHTIGLEKSTVLIEKLTEIIEKRQIKTVFAPYEKDAHDDHRETWQLAQQAVEHSINKPALAEYPIWLWKNGKQEDYPDSSIYNFFRLNVGEVQEVKNRAVAAHKSQVTRFIDDDPEGFCLTPEQLEPFTENEEYFFFRKKKAAQALDKEYFDTLYQKQEDPWNFEHSTYENDKYNKTLEVLNPAYKSVLEIGCSVGVLTEKLAARCTKLLAVDISEKPLEIAKKRCKNQPQVTFNVLDVSDDFPKRKYDLILISEMGYYLTEEKLINLYENCQKHLENQGQLLLVHWTGYVEEYPLSGKEVHRLFKIYNAKKSIFSKINEITQPEFELVLWEKNMQ